MGPGEQKFLGRRERRHRFPDRIGRLGCRGTTTRVTTEEADGACSWSRHPLTTKSQPCLPSSWEMLGPELTTFGFGEALATDELDTLVVADVLCAFGIG